MNFSRQRYRYPETERRKRVGEESNRFLEFGNSRHAAQK